MNRLTKVTFKCMNKHLESKYQKLLYFTLIFLKKMIIFMNKVIVLSQLQVNPATKQVTIRRIHEVHTDTCY